MKKDFTVKIQQIDLLIISFSIHVYFSLFIKEFLSIRLKWWKTAKVVPRWNGPWRIYFHKKTWSPPTDEKLLTNDDNTVWTSSLLFFISFTPIPIHFTYIHCVLYHIIYVSRIENIPIAVKILSDCKNKKSNNPTTVENNWYGLWL